MHHDLQQGLCAATNSTAAAAALAAAAAALAQAAAIAAAASLHLREHSLPEDGDPSLRC